MANMWGSRTLKLYQFKNMVYIQRPSYSNHILRTISPLQHNGHLDHRITQTRCMSKKGFFSQLYENITTEMRKNKEMKENLQKFREQRETLEKSDALKNMRKKFESMESETAKGTEVLKEKLGELKDIVAESDIGKKAGNIGEEVIKTAGKAAEKVVQTGHQVGSSEAFKTIAGNVKSLKKEMDETALSRAKMYKAPEKLQKRSDRAILPSSKEDKPVEADTDSTGVVMHKDSQWSQNWQNFKDNNQYVHKLFDLKMKYDESDNLVVRMSRTFTDKMSELFGGMFTKTEMSEVLTEIIKMDPTFDKDMFIRECQSEIIPNVLEALIRGDLDVLKDWCHEAPYNTLATPIKEAKKHKYIFKSRILDINNVDIVAAKVMEHGPVLIISFNAQQIMAMADAAGNIVEGDQDKVMKILYVWALCRDQSILDPKAAWKLMDLSASSQEIIL